MDEIMKAIAALTKGIMSIAKQKIPERRERMAERMLAGIISDSKSTGSYESLADEAIHYADALIAGLDKANPATTK